MEAVGLVVGILPIAVKAIDICRRLIGTKQSIGELLDELISLRRNLEELDKFLNSDSLRANNVTFTDTSVLISCSLACKTRLESLTNQLESANKDHMRRALWISNEKEHREITQQLRGLGLWIHMALSIEGCKLLSSSAQVVTSTLSQQLDQFQSLHDAVERQTKSMQTEYEKRHRAELLDWISDQTYKEAHLKARSSRVPMTGGWFLKEITAWHNDPSSSDLLWCQGKVGSGKTILTSLAIDEISNHIETPTPPMAYFFFKHQDREVQTLRVLLSSLLRQIVQSLPETPRSIIESHTLHTKKSQSLNADDCRALLAEALRASPCNLIILDALDEYSVQKQLCETIEQLRAITGTQILLTSRDPCPFTHAAILNIEAQDTDIVAYIREQLAVSTASELADHWFARRLEKTIVEKAQGMFLLPVVHLQAVLDEPTLGDMEETLASLPASLSQAFSATITRIQALPPKRARLGLNALMWVARSKRPLNVLELTDALAIKEDQQKIDRRYKPSAHTILACSQGLIVLDDDTGQFNLAHYSVQEYLDSNSANLFQQAEAKMAKTCLRYLLCEDFGDTPDPDEVAIRIRIASFPFTRYAVRFWGIHAQQEENDPEVWTLICRYINDRSRVANGDQIRRALKNYQRVYLSVEETMSVTPLHTASRFGLKRLARQILDCGQYQINVVTALLKTTPIILAASTGQVEMVQMLLQYRADPLIENWYGNALHCAAEAGSCEAVRVLIAYGMDPNAENNHGRVPLLCTLDNDCVDAFKTLLELGAKISAIDPDTSILLEAIELGATATLTWILKNKLVDINGEIPGIEPSTTALHYAVNCGDIMLISLLLQYGADPSLENDDGMTPIAYAQGNLAQRLAASGWFVSPAQIHRQLQHNA